MENKKCQFSGNNADEIKELKYYLNFFIEKQLITPQNNIADLLRIVHPDKRKNNTDITENDYTVQMKRTAIY